MTKPIKHQYQTMNNNLQIQANEFSREQIELIKRTVAPNTSDSELALFLHAARKYNLDPLLKEIWCVKYNNTGPVSIFTSRDGYLKIAHASGQFDGINSYTIDDEQGNPVKAVCEVWRKDMSRPFRAEVKYKEYFNPNNPTWRKYPSAMLIKVAEVFALRRAFCISGVSTVEEYDSAAPATLPAPALAPTPEPPAPATPTAPAPEPPLSEDEKEAALAIISRFHREKRKLAMEKFDTVTPDRVRKLIASPPFLSKEEKSRLLESMSERGISLSRLESHLAELYDIYSIDDITKDIFDEVMRFVFTNKE